MNYNSLKERKKEMFSAKRIIVSALLMLAFTGAALFAETVVTATSADDIQTKIEALANSDFSGGHYIIEIDDGAYAGGIEISDVNFANMSDSSRLIIRTKANGTNRAIFDGGGGVVFNIKNTVHFLTISNLTVKGYSDDRYGTEAGCDFKGATSVTNLIIDNVVFDNGCAAGDALKFYHNTDSATIGDIRVLNSTFQNNIDPAIYLSDGTTDKIGVYDLLISNCTFRFNTNDGANASGKGMVLGHYDSSQPVDGFTFVDNTIVSNSIEGSTLLQITGGTNLTISRNHFAHNSGELMEVNVSGTTKETGLMFVSNTIVNNSTTSTVFIKTSSSAGAYASTLYNLFASNEAANALMEEQNSEGDNGQHYFYHNTLADNTGCSDAVVTKWYGAKFDIKNCIFNGNSSSKAIDEGNNLTDDKNYVETGKEGQLSGTVYPADPQLSTDGEYRLLSGSPAMNAGASIAGVNDFISDGSPDIGYFEYFVPSVTITAPDTVAGLNKVSDITLTALVEHYDATYDLSFVVSNTTEGTELLSDSTTHTSIDANGSYSVTMDLSSGASSGDTIVAHVTYDDGTTSVKTNASYSVIYTPKISLLSMTNTNHSSGVAISDTDGGDWSEESAEIKDFSFTNDFRLMSTGVDRINLYTNGTLATNISCSVDKDTESVLTWDLLGGSNFVNRDGIYELKFEATNTTWNLGTSITYTSVAVSNVIPMRLYLNSVSNRHGNVSFSATNGGYWTNESIGITNYAFTNEFFLYFEGANEIRLFTNSITTTALQSTTGLDMVSGGDATLSLDMSSAKKAFEGYHDVFFVLSNSITKQFVELEYEDMFVSNGPALSIDSEFYVSNRNTDLALFSSGYVVSNESYTNYVTFKFTNATGLNVAVSNIDGELTNASFNVDGGTEETFEWLTKSDSSFFEAQGELAYTFYVTVENSDYGYKSMAIVSNISVSNKVAPSIKILGYSNNQVLDDGWTMMSLQVVYTNALYISLSTNGYSISNESVADTGLHTNTYMVDLKEDGVYAVRTEATNQFSKTVSIINLVVNNDKTKSFGMVQGGLGITNWTNGGRYVVTNESTVNLEYYQTNYSKLSFTHIAPNASNTVDTDPAAYPGEVKSYSWDIGEDDEGENTFIIKATDSSGSVDTYTYEVTIDNYVDPSIAVFVTNQNGKDISDFGVETGDLIDISVYATNGDFPITNMTIDVAGSPLVVSNNIATNWDGRVDISGLSFPYIALGETNIIATIIDSLGQEVRFYVPVTRTTSEEEKKSDGLNEDVSDGRVRVPAGGSAAVATVVKPLGVDAEFTVKIFDMRGALVKDLSDEVPSGSGYHDINWDGKNANGAEMGKGVYILFIQKTVGDETKFIRRPFVLIK